MAAMMAECSVVSTEMKLVELKVGLLVASMAEVTAAGKEAPRAELMVEKSVAD